MVVVILVAVGGSKVWTEGLPLVGILMGVMVGAGILGSLLYAWRWKRKHGSYDAIVPIEDQVEPYDMSKWLRGDKFDKDKHI